MRKKILAGKNLALSTVHKGAMKDLNFGIKLLIWDHCVYMFGPIVHRQEKIAERVIG